MVREYSPNRLLAAFVIVSFVAASLATPAAAKHRSSIRPTSPRHLAAAATLRVNRSHRNFVDPTLDLDRDASVAADGEHVDQIVPSLVRCMIISA
ncbi:MULTISPECIES: hypothetical protein [unclassified Afipia]|uniref:hypothetical protein n=1 Tax=unclassified Afipia TaxID=2642050 RepID=UPI0012692D3F|nr:MULTISPECIES: hypothetical protein [unclassified Afipia]